METARYTLTVLGLSLYAFLFVYLISRIGMRAILKELNDFLENKVNNYFKNKQENGKDDEKK